MSQETNDSTPGKEMASANQDTLKTQAPAQSINASDNPELISSLAAIVASREKSANDRQLNYRIMGDLIADLIASESSADRRAELENLLKVKQRAEERSQEYIRRLWKQLENLPKIGERVVSEGRKICERDSKEEER